MRYDLENQSGHNPSPDTGALRISRGCPGRDGVLTIVDSPRFYLRESSNTDPETQGKLFATGRKKQRKKNGLRSAGRGPEWPVEKLKFPSSPQVPELIQTPQI